MSSESPTRRLTRSQTSASVLGKRAATFAIPSSTTTASRKTNRLPTPDPTPNAKKARTSIDPYDPRANKENIPPFRNGLPESPTAQRSLSRRSSVSSDISTISVASRRSVSNLRRHATQPAIPQTPAKTTNEPVLASPPATPIQTSVPLSLRVRGLLRATSNSTNNMSFDGREEEHSLIKAFLTNFSDDEDPIDPVLYISGTPGTGKTALVNSIVSSIDGEDNVKIIFLNCMSITGMEVLWTRISEELLATGKTGTSRRSGAKKSMGKDEIARYLQKHSDTRCVLILDELDSLTGVSASAILPLFSLVASHPMSLRILGIANTHTLTSSSTIVPLTLDLSESAGNSSPKAKGKKSTQIKTIHFAPYNASQLLAILNKRLEALPKDELKAFLPAPTLGLLTKKVSSLTGDVRVLFEVLRGAIDIAVPSTQHVVTSDTPSKPTPVTPAHVLAALKSFTPAAPTKTKSNAVASTMSSASTSANSETATKVRNLGLQARLVLLAFILASRRILASLSLFSTSSAFNSSFSSPSTSRLSSSPSKRPRSPTKRTSSTSSTLSAPTSETSTSTSLDASQLYAFYTSLLTDRADGAFTPVSRPDFTDLLGILETNGLLTLSTGGGSSSSGSGTPRSLKRATSFASFSPSRMKGAGSGAGQVVMLPAHVRETEVVRGLGIGSETSDGDVDGDALEDDVRAIFVQEMKRMRREMKNRETSSTFEGVDSFEDAVQF